MIHFSLATFKIHYLFLVFGSLIIMCLAVGLLFHQVTSRCNFATPITGRGVDRSVKKQSFCMLLKLSYHKFKLEYYNFKMLNVTPMVTTKNMAIEYLQKLSFLDVYINIFHQIKEVCSHYFFKYSLCPFLTLFF